MIDANMMQHKVELTYKELYELAIVFPKLFDDFNLDEIDKWNREHPRLSNIMTNLFRIKTTVDNFKYEIGASEWETYSDFIGYLDDNGFQ